MTASVSSDDDDDDGKLRSAPEPPDEFQLKISAQNEKAMAQRERIKADWEDSIFVSARREDAKRHANELFKADKIGEAAAAYERLLPLCTDDEEMTVAVLSNLAAARIRDWRWQDALGVIDRVLALRPAHAKALYRQAQAHRGLKQLPLALASLAKSREATEASNKAAVAELAKLEQAVRNDIRKAEEAAAEKAAAQERKERRLRELADKQRRKLEASRDAGVALPPVAAHAAGSGGGEVAPTSGARSAVVSANWSSWLLRELSHVLTAEEARMMLYDEDGWIEVLEVPVTKAEVYAQVRTAADGTRALHYELDCVLHLNVAQFRAPLSDPGAIAFRVDVRVQHVDNRTPADGWKLSAAYCRPDDFRPSRRVERMMETYVKGRFLPYVREQVQSCLSHLTHEAAQAGSGERTEYAQAGRWRGRDVPATDAGGETAARAAAAAPSAAAEAAGAPELT